MPTVRLHCIVATLAGLLCVAHLASAQVRTTGQITGTVLDPSGAGVPAADIEVTDVGTGISSTTKSNDQGGFVLPNLQPGRYRVQAAAAGFEAAVAENVVVETGRTANLTMPLEVAGVVTEVQIVGRRALIEPTSSTVSSTVSNQEIARLPLSGRSVLNFALLTPGTTTSGPDGRFSSFNGLPGGAINITLDGVNNNSQRFRSGGTSFFTFAPVRLGAIEEVTVSTAGLTAEAGAQGAVQIQFVTRRGTNQFRGQVFDQIRNEGLNATSLANNAFGLPKGRLRQHEFGGNFGGPILRDRLFFFTNYEQLYTPADTTLFRTVLTPEAQAGLFRYVATDGSTRTASLLDIAAAAGFPARIDSSILGQLQIINNTLGEGSIRSSDPIRNVLSFQIPTNPSNLFPTTRVDWQVTPGIAARGILNLHWRDFTRSPQFPGLPLVNGGFESNYYILSTGVDWTMSSRAFNQLSFGFQSNREEFNPGATPDIYAPRRVLFPLGLTPAFPTDNLLPIPRNNPVYNLSNTVTLLRGNHTWSFGGTLRHTTQWEENWGGAAGGPGFSLGIAAGDPVSGIFSSATMPGVRVEDLGNARALYAFLTGRISLISGFYNIDESTAQFGVNPLTRREAQTVGGLYAQDSWRTSPRFTLNYGLRWELTGAAHNTNDLYTSPTREHLLGPSADLFQPGVFSDITDPQISLQPRPYKGSFLNFAPNAGFAWAPTASDGLLGRLLGTDRTAIRGSFGINYYDEGLVAFQLAAGNNPGLTQNAFLAPGHPGFPPGGLQLSSPIPPLFTFPADPTLPIPQSLFTFISGFSAVDPGIRTPYVANWSIGLQRQLGSNSAVEIRYVGNRGYRLWRSNSLNEVNIFENGFLEEFQNAQRNLEINRANALAGFANAGLPGQVALPMFEAAFGPRGLHGALPADSGFANGTIVTLLEQGQAGALAAQLAGNSLYLCRMVGGPLPACNGLGFNTPGPYPINVFQANPYAAGNTVNLLTDDSSSRYQGLQLQFRRYGAGLTMTTNYTYGKSVTDRYSDAPGLTVNLVTLRDKSRSEGPSVFDVRHAFQSYWTYELPIGRNRRLDVANPILNQIVGGWSVTGILRIQSGRPFLLTSGRATFNQYDAGVILNGISVRDLQGMVSVRPGPAATVYYFDERLIGPDGRANPEYIRSPDTPGELGQRVFVYGPGLWNVDLGLAKQFQTGGRTSLKVEALFLNALNHPNFLVGPSGFIDNGAVVNINGTDFGRTPALATGARNIQLRLQWNF